MLSLCLSTTHALQIDYDASLGTFPQAQGFNFFENVGYPAATVSGGVLHQSYFNNGTGDGVQYWSNTSLPVDFTQGTFVLDATLKIVNSDFKIISGIQDSGYFFTIADQTGRRLDIGLSNSRVTLNADKDTLQSLGVAVSPFDTTDAFHDYRFEVAQGTGSLFIDNIFVTSIPVGAIVGAPGSPIVLFGDDSGHTSNGSDLKRFSASYTVANTAPDTASTASLLGVTAATCFFLKRRLVKS